MAFKAVNIDIEWHGSGDSEYGTNRADGKKLVKVNPSFYRPAEVDLLIGDYSKAKSVLGWEPTTTLEDLCKIMVEEDINRVASGILF